MTRANNLKESTLDNCHANREFSEGRRRVLTLLSGCLGASFAPIAFAQASYPSRPIDMIVPFAAGGTSDLIARILAVALGNQLKTPVVCINKLGAAGLIGMKYVAAAAPDGYTIGMAGTTSLTIAPQISNPPPYDALRDFTPIGVAATGPFLLVVAPNVKAGTIAELVSLAKQRPDSLNYGSSGHGSFHHVLTELFNRSAGIRATHIPFKGGAENVNNLLAGTVDYMFESSSSILNMVKAGKIRALAVSGGKRISDLPQVPSLSEAGFKDVVIESFSGIVAPAGVPPQIANTLSSALQTVMAQSSVREAILRTGSDPAFIDAGEFGKLLVMETGRWHKIIAEVGIKAQ